MLFRSPVASGPGPGSVLPASQPIIRAPSEIALSSDPARNLEPSMPVAETSGNDAIPTLLDCCCGRRIPLAHAVLYSPAAIPYSQHAATWSKVRMRAYIFIAVSRLSARAGASPASADFAHHDRREVEVEGLADARLDAAIGGAAADVMVSRRSMCGSSAPSHQIGRAHV